LRRDQDISQRIYTEYPEVPESEFHHREIDESWSREWPEEYDEILDRVARLTHWRGETSTHQVHHIAEQYEVENIDVLEDVSTRFDELQVSQKDPDSEFRSTSGVILTSV